MDVVDQQTRSRMMAGIKGVNTGPEIYIRSGLHKQGFRFRTHVKNLPGKPDIVLPRYNAVVLVHGCFWHGHECHLFKWPVTRQEFWQKKIKDTCKRDNENVFALKKAGLRVAVLWECEIRKTQRHGGQLIDKLVKWLKGMEKKNFEIARINRED